MFFQFFIINANSYRDHQVIPEAGLSWMYTTTHSWVCFLSDFNSLTYLLYLQGDDNILTFVWLGLVEFGCII